MTRMVKLTAVFASLSILAGATVAQAQSAVSPRTAVGCVGGVAGCVLPVKAKAAPAAPAAAKENGGFPILAALLAAAAVVGGILLLGDDDDPASP